MVASWRGVVKHETGHKALSLSACDWLEFYSISCPKQHCRPLVSETPQCWDSPDLWIEPLFRDHFGQNHSSPLASIGSHQNHSTSELLRCHWSLGSPCWRSGSRSSVLAQPMLHTAHATGSDVSGTSRLGPPNIPPCDACDQSCKKRPQKSVCQRSHSAAELTGTHPTQ